MSATAGKISKHFVFWIVFLLLWSTHDLNYHNDILENLQNNIITFIPYAILVYTNLYVLMPRLLFNQQIFQYVGILIFCIGLCTWLTSMYLSYYFGNINVYTPTSLFFDSFQGKIAIATEVILSLCLSMTLFLIDEWYRKDRSMKEIEQKQLETELNLLKNQINPHFLFNSLNSIYIMLGKNLESGKNMLLQFSEILSHQLYETHKKYIRIEDEFDNLTNYIEIEKIRHEDLVTVKYNFRAKRKHVFISPMLLLPLVENAFKHGQSSYGYTIDIQAEITEEAILNFRVENTIPDRVNKKNQDKKGIGLSNVRRRLELIYPNIHEFCVESKSSRFIVQLKIQLHDNEMFNSR